jgi:hypothetical protein
MDYRAAMTTTLIVRGLSSVVGRRRKRAGEFAWKPLFVGFA